MVSPVGTGHAAGGYLDAAHHVAATDDDGDFDAELLGGDQVAGNAVDGRLIHAEGMRAGKIFARELDHHPTIDRLSHCYRFP